MVEVAAASGPGQRRAQPRRRSVVAAAGLGARPSGARASELVRSLKYGEQGRAVTRAAVTQQVRRLLAIPDRVLLGAGQHPDAAGGAGRPGQRPGLMTI